MSEQPHVHLVTREDGSTYTISVPKKLLRRFEHLCDQMADLIVELRTHAPDGGVYLHENQPYLMAGPSHVQASYREKACQENALVSGTSWPYSGGGAW